MSGLKLKRIVLFYRYSFISNTESTEESCKFSGDGVFGGSSMSGARSERLNRLFPLVSTSSDEPLGSAIALDQPELSICI